MRRSGWRYSVPLRPRSSYPFEVALPDAGSVRGVILADQIKSLDWRARRAEFAGRATRQVVDEVVGKIRAILEQKGR